MTRSISIGGLHTTQLGFGCGRLMRLPTRRSRMDLLAAAFDAGIRHFDVARMYGLGHAEAELGAFLRGRREQVVIATKFGISPGPAARLASGVQPVARALLRSLPGLKQLVARRANALYSRPRFDSVNAQRSLTESLRQLGTDYIDLLLLHEPEPELIAYPSLLDWLEGRRREGVIRQYGVAGHLEQVERVERAYPALCTITQFGNDALQRQIERRRSRAGTAITFSPISSAFREVCRRVDQSAAVRDRWTDQTGHDFKDPEAIGKFLVAYAVAANPQGVTLFFSSRPERIKRIAESIESGAVTPAALSAFLKLISERDQE